MKYYYKIKTNSEAYPIAYVEEKVGETILKKESFFSFNACVDYITETDSNWIRCHYDPDYSVIEIIEKITQEEMIKQCSN